jgi:hypothetical protein
VQAAGRKPQGGVGFALAAGETGFTQRRGDAERESGKWEMGFTQRTQREGAKDAERENENACLSVDRENWFTQRRGDAERKNEMGNGTWDVGQGKRETTSLRQAQGRQFLAVTGGVVEGWSSIRPAKGGTTQTDREDVSRFTRRAGVREYCESGTNN